MSAIRNSGRRTSRSAQSPYARPPPKKSSWSITGLLSFLNPLRSRSPVDDASDSNGSDVEEESHNAPKSPAVSLNKRGHQIVNDTYTQGNMFPHSSAQQHPQSSLPSVQSPHSESTSPAQNLERVSAQLKESLGIAGVDHLVSLLKEATSAEESEPFRFSSSPSTPTRGNSPFQGNVGFTFGSSATQLSTPSPRKTLNKNPNGVYRWQGGGSAKTPRSKNRYSSPAFGPSRSTPDRLVLKDTQIGTETPRTDTKRRRVGDEGLDSSFTPSGSGPTLPNGNVTKPPARAAAPDPSPTRVKQTLPFPVSAGSPTTPRTSNGISLNTNTSPSPSSSRLRAPPLSQKLTSPVVPSPLRQAWSEASSSSQSDAAPTTPSPAKQTKAAGFMTELIKEVTPPKRPDLSNPYQTSSPVGKIGPPKARVGKRVRATGRPAAPPEKDEKCKEKEKVYTPQAIIEATVPKGSKRSRPPAHFEKMTSSTREISPSPRERSAEPRTSKERSSNNRYAAYVVEEVDEEDEESKRATKKSRTVTINGGSSMRSSSSPGPMIEEVDDIDMGITPEKPQSVSSPLSSHPHSSATSGAAPSRPVFAGLKSTSVPKEPSKLRFSYQPEPASSSAAPLKPTFTPSPAPFKFTTTPTPPTPAPAPFTSPAFTDKTKDAAVEYRKKVPAKEAALAVPVHSLPKYTFSVTISVPSSSTPQQLKARNEAKTLSKPSLPSFDLTKPALKVAAPLARAPAFFLPPVKAFDWAAAGSKPAAAAAASSGATWTCSECMLSNPASAVLKCTICEAPRPTAAGSTPPIITGFNWAAAGMKPAAASGDGGNWTCSECMLSNPASVTDKCTVCDTPR